MPYLSEILHSVHPCITRCQYVRELLRYVNFNTCQLIYSIYPKMKLCNRLAWECFSAGMQCSVTRGSEYSGWTGPGSRCVTSVWWHGRKLRARLALTAAFAHSNAPCRPGPRPLSCCQHTDRLSWIISYLPNLSLQRRAPFGGL